MHSRTISTHGKRTSQRVTTDEPTSRGERTRHPRISGRRAGYDAASTISARVWGMVEGGFASEHDALIANKVAYVLCGGDGTPRNVTEQDLLDLEREQFLSLLGTKETQERIAYTLKTGKPLRN
jgi:3-hydroxyacyl-CoA dehydrogenase